MPSERSRLHSILARHELRPAKGLGQHFLVDEDVLRSIAKATGAAPDATVAEVGAGVGNLTTLLAMSGARVIAIELDPKFKTIHQEIQLADADLSERLRFDYTDALAFDYLAASKAAAAEGRRFLIAGNIPYQITTPLVMTILDSRARFDAMTFLIQREVAERLAAAPGSRRNSAITIKVHYDCEVELLLNVDASAFMPPPEVDSQVIQFRLKRPGTAADGAREMDAEERSGLFRLVDAAFSHRRKMMSNSVVASGLGYTKVEVDEALQRIGFSTTARAEQLDVNDFLTLKRELDRDRPAGE